MRMYLLAICAVVASGSCGPGTYSSTGAAPCKDCTSGEYQDGSGQTSCKTCAANEGPATAAGPCEVCAAGKYAGFPDLVFLGGTPDSYDLAVCEGDCDANGHCDGSLECFQRDTNADSVPGCHGDGAVAGSTSAYDYCYDPNWTSGCTDCPAGQYQDETGQGSCKVCAAGTVLSTALGSCEACAAGKYEDSGTCTDCPVGQYQDETGQGSCTAFSATCTAGKVEQVAATPTSDRLCAVPPDDVTSCNITSGTCLTHLSLLECNALAWDDVEVATEQQPTPCTAGADLGCMMAYLSAAAASALHDDLKPFPVRTMAGDGTSADACATACYAVYGADVTLQVALRNGECYCITGDNYQYSSADTPYASCASIHRWNVWEMGTCTKSPHPSGCSKDQNGYYYNTQPDALAVCANSECLCATCATAAPTAAPTQAPTAAPTPAPTPPCSLTNAGVCSETWGDETADLDHCYALLLAFGKVHPGNFTNPERGESIYNTDEHIPFGCHFIQNEYTGTWIANVNQHDTSAPCTPDIPCACADNCRHLPILPAPATLSPTPYPTPLPTPAPTPSPTPAPTPSPTPTPPPPTPAPPTPAPTPFPICYLYNFTCTLMGLSDLSYEQCNNIEGRFCRSVTNANGRPGVSTTSDAYVIEFNHATDADKPCTGQIPCLCAAAHDTTSNACPTIPTPTVAPTPEVPIDPAPVMRDLSVGMHIIAIAAGVSLLVIALYGRKVRGVTLKF